MEYSKLCSKEQPRPTWTQVLGLEAITRRFEAADRRARRAATISDREVAESERREAAGAFWAVGEDLADLFLLLLRYACRHRPEALAAYLADVLDQEIGPLAEAVARLERGRK
jgi:hypothetical protein